MNRHGPVQQHGGAGAENGHAPVAMGTATASAGGTSRAMSASLSRGTETGMGGGGWCGAGPVGKS